MRVFDWCRSNQHDRCIREYQRFVVDPKSNKVVALDETVKCQCRKRGCKCYVPPALREKPKRKPRRKK